MQDAHAFATMKEKRSGIAVAGLVVATVCLGCGSSDDSDTSAIGGGGDGGSAMVGGGGDGGSGGSGGAFDVADVAWQPVGTSTDTPLRRWGHAVARIDGSRAVLLGGTAQGAENVTLSDSWLVDTSAGEITFTEIDAEGPEPRYCACAIWDAAREKVVAVGGRNLAGPMSSETWELDVESETWTQVDVPMSPPGVVGCALARSEQHDATYLFGGGSAMGFTSSTYRYDPSVPEWVELDATGPSSRYDATMIPIDDGASLLLFAGSTSSKPYSDVWRFDVATESWSEIVMSGTPPPGRRVPWMVEAPGGGFLVGLGLQGAQPMPDLWHLDLENQAWTGIHYEAPFGPRAFTPAIPGGPNALGMFVGGFDGSGPVADAWQLQLP